MKKYLSILFEKPFLSAEPLLMLKHSNISVKFGVIALSIFLSFLNLNSAQAQDQVIVISGKVTDVETKEPLVGVTVAVKNTITGTITDNKGAFTLKAKLKFPFTLIFSMVGFQPQEYNITSPNTSLIINLQSQTILGNEVVVTASRVEESILKSPVSIEKLDIRAIKESPAPSFYDALENVKGVQMTTSSLTFKVPNTRGFNIPNNFRFMQLVDGVDMQAATLGVPLGNAIGPTELDIESVEITPGAASALYGMNAINGMANMITKSPFTYQGLSIYQKTGVNHVDGKDYSPSILTETSVRYAKSLNDKVAFKINGSYMQGTDWLSNTRTDQNPQKNANPNFPELSGSNNPAYDAWNKYGDESNGNVAIPVFYDGKDQTFNVRRTGYWEKDLINPHVKNMKFDGSIYYRITPNAQISYGYRVGQMDGIFQRGNKVQLRDVNVQNHKLEIKGANYFVRGYTSIENTGNSYNLKPLADNLDLNNGSNTDWGNRFKSSLQSSLNNGEDLTSAMQAARAFADQGRVEAGTPQFDSLKRVITHVNNWDIANTVPGAPQSGGAWLLQKSRLYHLDAQWDLSKYVKIADVLVGADYRVYQVIPDGNNFVDFSKPLADRNQPGGNNLYYTKYGVFTQVSKKFLAEKLKVVGSLRFDQNLDFTPRVNPRIAAVYTLKEQHNFRISYQNGFRFPALFEALSFVNNGNVRRVGGLPGVNEGLGYLDNSYTLASLNTFNNSVNADVAAGYNRTQAALRNRDLLQITNLKPTQPERINSFEIGYKSLLFDNKLVIDWDAYTNLYTGFLGQVEVAVPVSGKVGSDEAVLDMLSRGNQVRYRVYTNAKNTYNNYGSSIALTYNFYKKFTVGGNLNYNSIQGNSQQDVFVTGFNTPRWITNLSFGNREVIKNLGFNVVWKWQSQFDWQSPLANGTVPSYNTLDAQVTLKVPTLKSAIKVGGTNLLNKRYIQYAAGPTIGGLYYVALTIDGLLQ